MIICKFTLLFLFVFLLNIIDLCYFIIGDDMLKDINIKIYNIVRSLIAFLVFWFGGYYFKFIPVLIFKLDITKLTMKDQVLLSLFSSVLLTVIFLIIYRKDLKVELKRFKNNFIENMDQGIRYWLFGIAIMMIVNLILTFVLKTGGANNENAIQDMLKVSPFLMLINAGFIAPFNEEIAFRKTLKDVFNNKWLFVFLSFLLFGGAHVIGSATSLTDYLYIIPYGALGGAFALAYYKTDTIFTSMSFHMIHNIALTLLAIL